MHHSTLGSRFIKKKKRSSGVPARPQSPRAAPVRRTLGNQPPAPFPRAPPAPPAVAFRVSSFVFRVSCLGFRVQCFGFRVSGAVFWVSGPAFRIQRSVPFPRAPPAPPAFAFRVSGVRHPRFGAELDAARFFLEGGVRVSSVVFRVSGSVFKVQRSVSSVKCFGCSVPGLAFRVSGLEVNQPFPRAPPAFAWIVNNKLTILWGN